MSHPDAVIEYRRSRMILHIYSDSSYILEPKTHRRSGGYFFLGPKSNTPITAMPPENYPVHVEYSILIDFMVSATEP